MKKVFRTVQFGANLGMIVVSLLLVFIVVGQYVLEPEKPDPVVAYTTSPQTSSKTTTSSLAGLTVPLQGVNWQDSRQTVVLYISTTCHFCAESTPFYQQLIKEKANSPFRLIAVLPEKGDEANRYLESHEIKADQVLNASLGSIGVTATPTLMLVNENGVISDSWRGKLTEDKQAEVIARLSD